MKKQYVLLHIDMSYSLSGIGEHTNTILFITNDEEEMDEYVKEHKYILNQEKHLYHSDYEAYVVQTFSR